MGCRSGKILNLPNRVSRCGGAIYILHGGASNGRAKLITSNRAGLNGVDDGG